MPAAHQSHLHRAGFLTGVLTLGLAACQGTISSAGASGAGGSATGGATTPGSGGATGTGNAGGATATGGGGASPAGSGGAASFGACKPSADPGVTPLQRLSALQYRNTVRDLLTGSGLASLADEVTPMLSTIPDDSTPSFRGLDTRVSAAHVEGAYNVAAAIGNAIEASPTRLTALAGSCAMATTLTMKCVDDLLASFGRRAFRHPLSTDDVTNFRALNDGTRGPAEAIRAIVVTLLMSPRFVNQVETEGTMQGSNATLLKLDPYEVASRLSYTFWQTMPDEALLAAAADGSLGTDAGFATQLDRVFNDARTRTTLWQFWNEWFHLEGFTGFSSERPAFQALAKGENLGVAGHDHWGDMVTELRELTELYTWTRKGTLTELLTTDLSVTRSADLAHLYGVTAWSGTGDYPRFPAGTRVGILQRAGLLANSIETTNPFHRGSFVRRNVLCDPLPRPDPNSLPPGSLDPPPPSPTDTTRQRFAKKVTSTLCMSCHAGFSDIGYTLEAFDALGRYRTSEKVYDEQDGHLVAELPIDTTAVPQVVAGDKQQVAGPAQLNQLIADSGKVATCLSGNYFRYALRREPTTDSGDACVSELLDAQLRKPDVSLADVFKALAQQGSFRQRKVGAP